MDGKKIKNKFFSYVVYVKYRCVLNFNQINRLFTHAPAHTYIYYMYVYIGRWVGYIHT